MKNAIFYFALLLTITSCIDNNPNLNTKGEDILEAIEIFGDEAQIELRDTVYIPIYSDIYSKGKDTRFNLTATLSIRNTSLTDSIYIEGIDYYDTNGDLVREYIDRILLLTPMQSIEYVIEEGDTSGGTGANFIVNWGANSDQVKPIFQGIMISTHGQQGISFITDGVSISRR